MAHARKQIRDAAAAAVTGLATTGGNVFVGRATRVPASELPALLVYTARGEEGGEESELINMSMGAGKTLQRLVRLAIEGVVALPAGGAVDDGLDQIAAEVEAALGGNKLGGLVKAVELQGSEIGLEGEGDKLRGYIRMTWAYLYHTAEDAPEVAL